MSKLTNLAHLKVMRKKCKDLFPKQVENVVRMVFKERVGIAFSAPSDMAVEDKLFLYSIVRAFKPSRALEIGVSKGGSALIITSAMEDNHAGTLVGIDPTPNINCKKEAFYSRYTLLKNSSPEAIPEAVELLGGQLDFVLLDSIHIFDQVYKELETILPSMAEGGIILIHDAFHYGVNAAIRKIIEEHKDVIDCGFVNRAPVATVSPWTPYGGLYMLRISGKGSTYLKLVELAYEGLNLPLPHFGEDILNHDFWYCSIKPCERCVANKTVKTDSDEL